MKRDDSVYIRHIADAIDRIEKYTSGVDENTFLTNSLIQDAVIRQLEVIGEAAKRLSPELRQATAEIPWQDVAGMRDKLIHGYFGVEISQVWLTVANDIPALKARILTILQTMR
jgi:uncharacterized protein with HEPN domain